MTVTADAIARRFKRIVIGQHVGGIELWECQSCGALVKAEKTRLHHEFHLHAEDTNRLARGRRAINERTPMPIKTLSYESVGAQSIAEVEVTHPGEGAHVSWEFYCEDCDTLISGLTQSEAELELTTHACGD